MRPNELVSLILILLIMRRKIVAGNWKMNLDFQEAQDLVESIANLCEEKQPDCDIITQHKIEKGPEQKF